jgi:hypothetical protein
LDDDLENIEAALDWSMSTPEGAAEALTVVRSLERYWMARGVRRAHGIRWSTVAAERATTVSTAARVEGLLGAVLLLVWSDLPAARTLADKAANLAAADGDPTAQGYATLARVWVDLFGGVTDGAASLVAQVCELIDPGDVVHPWTGAAGAVLQGLRGDWAGAAKALNAVAAESAAKDDAHMAGAWLSCAADFEFMIGDVAAARAHVAVGLHQAGVTDCASCESLALGAAALLEADSQVRLTTARRSLRLADGIGEVWGALGALEVTVDGLAATGRYADAALLAGAARAMRAATGFVSVLPGRTVALDRGDATARAALDRTTYEALMRDGATLDYASAVAHALG